MFKIRQYFSTLEIIQGFFISFLGAAFIYFNYWGFDTPLIQTICGLSTLFLLLGATQHVWFWYGVGSALLWFWWIPLSLQHYGYAWGFPIGLILIGLINGVIFGSVAWVLEKLFASYAYIPKALSLLLWSYLHPFGFDWFKPELMFVQSYIGIDKWQLGLVLVSMVLAYYRKNLLFLLPILFAYNAKHVSILAPQKSDTLTLTTTHTSVEDKWNIKKHRQQFKILIHTIDDAILAKKQTIVFPESVFPIFLNHDHRLMQMLHQRAQKINIITGGLYWDGKTPHNSTYIFTKSTMQIAHKVLLVPFGESNPLPDFLSDWINKVFYDGAVDYKADNRLTDYTIDGITYRNAICFEATSEKLYEGQPKHMIILSNNGWFTPSTEPTLQKLLLVYYSKKYGTTIYHSVNMSESYIIRPS